MNHKLPAQPIRPAQSRPAASNKLLAIVGPTASGKSELAVSLAKKFNGEVISVDSRQIYRGMNIGTGKVPGQWVTSITRGRARNKYFVYKKIIHHLIDFVNPRRQYSAAKFKNAAQKTISDIQRRGKLPILCGGTAHWIDAIVFNQNIPDVKPSSKLRKQLDNQTADHLYLQLQKLDPVRASAIDRFNKRRLIRALEIVIITGKPVPVIPGFGVHPTHSIELKVALNTKEKAINIRNPKLGLALDPGSQPHSPGMTPTYKTLWLGINPPQEVLYKKIEKRLKQRLRHGMVEEVQILRSGIWEKRSPNLKSGVSKPKSPQPLSWQRLESFGLEYKFIALYLQGKLSYAEMAEQLSYAIKHYSKRQLTWWKRNPDIHWICNKSEASAIIKNFI